MPVRLRALELGSLDRPPLDAYVVFVAEDERPLWGLAGLLDWQLAGGLTKLLQNGSLSGSASEALLTVTSGKVAAPRVLAFGLGPQGKLNAEAFARVATKAAEAVAKAKLGHVLVGLPEVPKAAIAARALHDAFAKVPGEMLLCGDLQELALALPDLAAKER